MMTQLAVITGAGQGMGRAIALKLAAQGVRVVLVGRTRDKLDSVAAEMPDSAPIIAPLDVSDSAAVTALAEQLAAVSPHLDMLINCAGESFIAALDETTDADWQRLIAANLTGPFVMARALLPLLRRSPNASIVHIVSKVALRGYAPIAAYTAAKTGLLGFTRALAMELRPDEIRVVAVCPGPVDTPMRWAATPDFDRKLVIDASAVADTVWHLVTLPRGITTGDILVQSVYYD